MTGDDWNGQEKVHVLVGGDAFRGVRRRPVGASFAGRVGAPRARNRRAVGAVGELQPQRRGRGHWLPLQRLRHRRAGRVDRNRTGRRGDPRSSRVGARDPTGWGQRLPSGRLSPVLSFAGRDRRGPHGENHRRIYRPRRPAASHRPGGHPLSRHKCLLAAHRGHDPFHAGIRREVCPPVFRDIGLQRRGERGPAQIRALPRQPRAQQCARLAGWGGRGWVPALFDGGRHGQQKCGLSQLVGAGRSAGPDRRFGREFSALPASSSCRGPKRHGAAGFRRRCGHAAPAPRRGGERARFRGCPGPGRIASRHPLRGGPDFDEDVPRRSWPLRASGRGQDEPRPELSVGRPAAGFCRDRIVFERPQCRAASTGRRQLQDRGSRPPSFQSDGWPEFLRHDFADPHLVEPSGGAARAGA